MKKAFILFTFLLLTACSKESPIQVRVESGWVADIPPGIRVTGAFMVLHNNSKESVYLIGASTPNADRIEIHRSILVDELAKMRRQDEVLIPPEGSLSFDSHTGYHLMVYAPKPFKLGELIPITLEFKESGSFTFNFEVAKRQDRW